MPPAEAKPAPAVRAYGLAMCQALLEAVAGLVAGLRVLAQV